MLWYYFFVFSRRVCVMFTSLESEAFYLQRMVYLSYKKPREANLTSCDASKGWKKCNVYCCTIFSNKRTQNLFALICMQTLPDDWHFFFSYLGPGWHALFSRVPSVPPLLPPSHFFPLGPISSCWICIHSVCICTANLFLSGVYSLPISPMSVPAECEHKCETAGFTNAGKLSKRLTSCTTLLPQQHENTFQFLLQFCKKCVHFCFFASH